MRFGDSHRGPWRVGVILGKLASAVRSGRRLQVFLFSDLSGRKLGGLRAAHDRDETVAGLLATYEINEDMVCRGVVAFPADLSDTRLLSR